MKKKKNERHGIISRLSDASGIPFDMLTSLPMIKMTSNREIVIEDAGALEHYESGCVRLSQGRLCVCINGVDLRIKCLADNSISVTGYITGVGFDRGGGER